MLQQAYMHTRWGLTLHCGWGSSLQARSASYGGAGALLAQRGALPVLEAVLVQRSQPDAALLAAASHCATCRVEQ